MEVSVHWHGGPREWDHLAEGWLNGLDCFVPGNLSRGSHVSGSLPFMGARESRCDDEGNPGWARPEGRCFRGRTRGEDTMRARIINSVDQCDYISLKKDDPVACTSRATNWWLNESDNIGFCNVLLCRCDEHAPAGGNITINGILFHNRMLTREEAKPLYEIAAVLCQ